MKNIIGDGPGKIILLIVIFFNMSCKKELNISNNEKSIIQIKNLSKDPDFITYISEIKAVENSLENANPINKLDEKEFTLYFTKAVKYNDISAKRIISNSMGFHDDSSFWISRSKRIIALKNLNAKYNFSNLGEQDVLMSLQNINTQNEKIKSNGMNLKTFFFDGPDCLEIYKNCKDNVSANYAMDQIVCVSAGALGWTGIGILTFLACEAASNYRMYVGDKACLLSFKNCTKS